MHVRVEFRCDVKTLHNRSRVSIFFTTCLSNSLNRLCQSGRSRSGLSVCVCVGLDTPIHLPSARSGRRWDERERGVSVPRKVILGEGDEEEVSGHLTGSNR